MGGKSRRGARGRSVPNTPPSATEDALAMGRTRSVPAADTTPLLPVGDILQSMNAAIQTIAVSVDKPELLVDPTQIRPPVPVLTDPRIRSDFTGSSDAPVVQASEDQEASRGKEPVEIEEEGSEDDEEVPGGIIPPPDVNLMIIEGYPNPSDLRNDAIWASSVLSSLGFKDLKFIKSDVITSSGKRVIRLSATSCTISPYAQVVLAFTAKYYSTLPPAPFEIKVLELVFAVNKAHTSAGASIPNHLAMHYQDIDGEGLVHLALIVAGMLIPSEMLRGDLETLAGSALELNAIYDEAKAAYPMEISAYNVMYQILFGGPRVISPIPEIIRHDAALEMYINLIASGAGTVAVEQVELPARSMSSPVYRPAIASETPIVPLPEAPPAPVQQQPLIRIASYTPPPPIRPLQPQAPVIQSQALPGQSSNTQEETQATRAARAGGPRSLLRQGRPEGQTIERDTTAFRAGVDTLIELQQGMNQVQQIATANNVMLTNQSQEYVKFNDRLARLEAMMSVLIAQRAATEQMDRAVLNQALLAPPPPADTTPVVAGSSQENVSEVVGDSRLATLIARLKNMKNLQSDPTLPKDVREFMVSRNKPNMAKTMIDAAFASADGRKRIQQRLETMPQ